MLVVRLARKIPGAKILVETTGGDLLVLLHRFAHRDDARLLSTLRRIRDAGVIDPAHWRAALPREF